MIHSLLIDKIFQRGTGVSLQGDRELVHVTGLGGVPETFGRVSGHLPDGVD